MKNANAIREAFLQFFERKKHIRVPSSSLVPSHDDPSVLLTTAGMQQFKSYFIGEKDAKHDFGGTALASVQRCFRTADIDSVGDPSHLTFFEMLGNFSFHGYFKREAISYAWEFLTKDLGIPKSRLWVTIFSGDKNAPRDTVSEEEWAKHLPKKRIRAFGRADNWWGPTGNAGPCGPSSEVHIDLGADVAPDEKDDGPNSGSGRFLEIWNLVFTEYFQDAKGVVTELKTKNIDTGMGLERLTMVLQKKPTVYETDLYIPLHRVIHASEPFNGVTDTEKTRAERIIMDHIKGVAFLLADGVEFSNKDQGYIMRRIYRRALDQCDHAERTIPSLLHAVGNLYRETYPHIAHGLPRILGAAETELATYAKVLRTDVSKILERMDKHRAPAPVQMFAEPSRRPLSPDQVFQLYTTYGFSLERLRRKGYEFDDAAVAERIASHREISKRGQEKKFGGHGLHGGFSMEGRNVTDVWRITRQHTATHLLHQALRTVLGNTVRQSGSDITPERLRFDFTHPAKLTDEQRRAVEDLVNKKITEDLPVVKKEMPTEEALASGALSFFKEKYGSRSTVYEIGDFSKELCGGPHVPHTAQIGYFRIVSEKSNAAGIRRIKAVVEDSTATAAPAEGSA